MLRACLHVIHTKTSSLVATCARISCVAELKAPHNTFRNTFGRKRSAHKHKPILITHRTHPSEELFAHPIRSSEKPTNTFEGSYASFTFAYVSTTLARSHTRPALDINSRRLYTVHESNSRIPNFDTEYIQNFVRHVDSFARLYCIRSSPRTQRN